MTAEERLRKSQTLDQEGLTNSDNYFDVEEENGKF